VCLPQRMRASRRELWWLELGNAREGFARNAAP
jgi:hypothetical protein